MIPIQHKDLILMPTEIPYNISLLNLHSTSTKIEKLESNHPWLSWTLYYLSFIIAAFLCAFVFVNYFNPNHTDVNSARYLLSALVQSESAIIAIVITLTLVAVQLTASAYTPRVANIFASSPHMYLILGIYIISIAYGAIILQLLSGIEGTIPISTEFCVSLAYWLAIFLAIALIPYISNSLELLKTENILKRLSKQMTKETVLQINQKNDLLDSIFDIIHRSILKYDATTVREGLDLLTPQIIASVSTKNNQNVNSEIVSIYCTRLARCGKQAADIRDEEILGIVIDNFEKIGNHAVSFDYDNPTWQVIDTIRDIEKTISERELTQSLNRILEVLETIGEKAISQDFRDTSYRIFYCYELIGKHAIEKTKPMDRFDPFSVLSFNIVESMEKLGKLSIEKSRKEILNLLISYLLMIGKYGLDKEMLSLAEDSAIKILDLWKLSLELGKENQVASFIAAHYLSYHVKKKMIEKFGYESYLYERDLLDIGVIAGERKIENVQRNAATLLADLRKIDAANFQTSIQDYDTNLTESQKIYYREFLALQEKIFIEIVQKNDGPWIH